MMMVAINQAIIDRIKADTGTDGLFSGSAGTTWNTTLFPGGGGILGVTGSPTNASRPYGLYTINTVQTQHTFKSDGFTYQIAFAFFDDPSQGLARLVPIADRLFGNRPLQANGIPTYGLHGHTLVLPTNLLLATCTACRCVSSNSVETIDPDRATLTMAFEFSVSSKEY
jgi:hypothetical protein